MAVILSRSLVEKPCLMFDATCICLIGMGGGVRAFGDCGGTCSESFGCVALAVDAAGDMSEAACNGGGAADDTGAVWLFSPKEAERGISR
jgi:hypothetical protein